MTGENVANTVSDSSVVPQRFLNRTVKPPKRIEAVTLNVTQNRSGVMKCICRLHRRLIAVHLRDVGKLLVLTFSPRTFDRAVALGLRNGAHEFNDVLSELRRHKSFSSILER